MITNIKTAIIKINGMTCVSCENRIERKMQTTKGISSVKVSYSTGIAEVRYDVNIIRLSEIISIIESLDYKAEEASKVGIGTNNTEKKDNNIIKLLGAAIILLALYMVINHFGWLNLFYSFPLAKEGMGYGMLFVIGLLTSIHCVAMCGGINLSQCIPHSSAVSTSGGKTSTLRPSILYNLGRVISYTVIGGIVGAVGSVISFSGTAKGFVQLAAGIFMIIMGLNMLNIFPWLKKLNPRMPKIFARKINEQKISKSPFYVGLLNGLMPCGPLQAMQLYALSTGNSLKGALSMLLFSLGTVPLMFGLGALSSILSKKFSHKMMTVSAVLVVVLGTFMFSSGIALTGITMPSLNISSSTDKGQYSNIAQISGDVQNVTTELASGRYEPITVVKGIPVVWTIKAEAGDINGCNNEIVIPKYNIKQKLQAGDNIVKFTPDESGSFAYSCWMGMIRSKITVINDEKDSAPSTTDEVVDDSGLPNCCG